MTDELTSIAQYMVREMTTNANGKSARRMLRLNQTSADACIAEYNRLPFWQKVFGFGLRPNECLDMEISNGEAALLLWGFKVRQGGEWDHKPKIRTMFHPRVPNGTQEWHLYNTTLYFYDAWSNIHYGYVGRAAGFSDDVLLDGAGLEQIGSNALRGAGPQCSGMLESGLRACDDSHDRAAILIGLRLFAEGGLTAQRLLNAVINSKDIEQKTYLPPAR